MTNGLMCRYSFIIIIILQKDTIFLVDYGLLCAVVVEALKELREE